jgi:pyridoxal phosphate enzyme (YggS family)
MTQSQDKELRQTLEQRLNSVKEQIKKAAIEARRYPDDVRLIAVGKTFDAEAMIPAIEAGQRLFGENRVQEAKSKWPELKDRFPDLELHLIGPMQSNKVKDAVSLFDVIHTIDRPKIARAVCQEMKRTGRKPKLLVQINTGEEPQKSGVLPIEADNFVGMCKEELGLEICGLMCIPPLDEEPSLHFALLQKMAEKLDLPELSMGMSGDFEKAIMFGATYVRVGTSIFGCRR